MLRNRSFRTETDEGSVLVERHEGNVTAEFLSSNGDDGWSHSVPVEPFVSALAQVVPEAEQMEEVRPSSR
ncbi:hypothetical protein [Fimbriimonas ginsengisoli]|uniref:hypothetical protein n=1 Tax=Fimbriimonas ginsengisoli TaxID=1005039 RepID=UPI0004B67CF4|nr:hypothetical protein [Fimbriimonas ginsengisoli]